MILSAPQVLKKTEIEKPAYPVIDFHMHMGKMLLGESYETKYDTKEYVRELQDARCMRCEYGWIFRKRSGKDAKRNKKDSRKCFLILCSLIFLRMMILIFAIKTKKVIEDSCMRGCRGDQIMERSFAVGAG